MSIGLVVTRGFGTGTQTGTIPFVVTRGYNIGISVTVPVGDSDVSLSGLLDSDIGLSSGLDSDINLSGLLDSDINLSGGL